MAPDVIEQIGEAMFRDDGEARTHLIESHPGLKPHVDDVSADA